MNKAELRAEINACFERLWDLDTQLTQALRSMNQDAILDLEQSITTVMAYQLELEEQLNYLNRTLS